MDNNQKLINLVNDLLSHFSLSGFKYSFTINSKNLINSYSDKRIFNYSELDHILSLINSIEVKTFNLTIENRIEYPLEDRKRYWYNIDYIFFTENKHPACQISFLSSGLSLYNLQNSILVSNDGINKIRKIGDTYLKCSKEIYSVMSKLNY